MANTIAVEKEADKKENEEYLNKGVSMADVLHALYETMGDDWRLVHEFDIDDPSHRIKKTRGIWNRFQAWLSESSILELLSLLAGIGMALSGLLYIAISLIAIYQPQWLEIAHQYHIRSWLLQTLLASAALWFIGLPLLAKFLEQNCSRWKRDNSSILNRQVKKVFEDQVSFRETNMRFGYPGQRLATIEITLEDHEPATLYLEHT